MPLPNTPDPVTPKTTIPSSPPPRFAENLLLSCNMTPRLAAPPLGFLLLLNSYNNRIWIFESLYNAEKSLSALWWPRRAMSCDIATSIGTSD